jgi:hypothetical protein
MTLYIKPCLERPFGLCVKRALRGPYLGELQR